MRRYRKLERQENLQEIITKHPFYSDKDLAEHFEVSVPTIRLDRAELGIPELRERTRVVAQEVNVLKALGQKEIVGELRELVIGERGRSELIIDEKMVLEKAKVARGHHLFGQANSLAMALVDAEVALTGSAQIKFVRPVQLGERVVAEGRVMKRREDKYWIEVRAKVQTEEVLWGKWVMFGFPSPPVLPAEEEKA
ncbi:MAG: transcription factor FapR [Desulfitobacteriaceae bacterium]